MLVKICGIKNQTTLLCCEKNKVNFFGMIFYEKSPRNIDLVTAKYLQSASKDLEINGVGVYVDKNIDELEEHIKYLGLNFIQLHGNEDDKYIDNIKKLDVKVIKKISIEKVEDLENIKFFKTADYYLFDYKPNINDLPGGNAKSFNWNIIIDLQINKPWFLSGGVNLNNLEIIKNKINPFGLDLSSGVEKKLGIKDNEIINNFMENLNDA